MKKSRKQVFSFNLSVFWKHYGTLGWLLGLYHFSPANSITVPRGSGRPHVNFKSTVKLSLKNTWDKTVRIFSKQTNSDTVCCFCSSTQFHKIQALNNVLFWKVYDVSTQLPKMQFIKPPGYSISNSKFSLLFLNNHRVILLVFLSTTSSVISADADIFVPFRTLI